MWEDVRVSIARLVVVGPPADKEVDEVCEVSLLVQEMVHGSADVRW